MLIIEYIDCCFVQSDQDVITTICEFINSIAEINYEKFIVSNPDLIIRIRGENNFSLYGSYVYKYSFKKDCLYGISGLDLTIDYQKFVRKKKLYRLLG